MSLLFVAPLVGCSSGSESAEETTTTTSTTTTTTTTTTTPQQGAAATYFFVVGDLNVQQDAINERYVDPATGEVSTDEQQAYCREAATAQQAFVQRLSTASFPPQYQSAVNDVVTRASSAVSLSFECANTPPAALRPGFFLELQAATSADRQAVDALRGLLGLPIER